MIEITKKISKNILPESGLIFIRYLFSYVAYLKYGPLLQENKYYKGAYFGKTAFLLGSGPSIKNQNLQLLRDQNIISLNNAFVFDGYEEFVTGEGGKFHLIAPIHPPISEIDWVSWLSEMEKKIPENVILVFGLNFNKVNVHYLVSKYKLFKKHKIIWYLATRPFFKKKLDQKISDINKPIFAAEAASIYGIMVADFLGFDSLYLLGMDHDYFLHSHSSEMRAYKEAEHQKHEQNQDLDDDFYIQELFSLYKISIKYKFLKESLRINVLNASAGGVLKIFERCSYEKLFK